MENIRYARTGDGIDLPVIDVTQPAFALDLTEEELTALTGSFVDESRSAEMPPALREALLASTLGRALMAASGSFLGGIATYLLKLGPDHFKGDGHEIDRRIASSFPALVTRLRLQDMVRLLAEKAAPLIEGAPARPICFVNIGGGAGADSWNALLWLQSMRPELLGGRRVTIAVLDVDGDGPRFGASAVSSLRAAGGPLASCDLAFRSVPYNWSQPAELTRILGDLEAAHAACLVSSEGALFEYGSDALIVDNLTGLRAATAADAIVVGSVTRESEAPRASQIGATTRPRTFEAFGALCREGGWAVERSISRPFTFNVRLTRETP